MIVNHRPSILHRPLKSQSQANVETSDSQHAREQDKLAYKAALSQATQDRLMRSLYPMPGDKELAYDELRAVTDQQLSARERERQSAAEEEAVWVRRSAGNPLPQRPDERPWLATTLHYSASEEAAARRRFAAEVAEENYRAMAAKADQRTRQRSSELEGARRDLGQEASWFNLGAAQDRWVAPEHRRPASRPGTAPSSGRGAGAAPYACSWDQPQPQGGGTAAASAAASPRGAHDAYRPQYQQQAAAVAAASPRDPLWAWDTTDTGRAQVQPQMRQDQTRPSTASSMASAGRASGAVASRGSRPPWAVDEDARSNAHQQAQRPASSSAVARQYPWSWQ